VRAPDAARASDDAGAPDAALWRGELSHFAACSSAAAASWRKRVRLRASGSAAATW